MTCLGDICVMRERLGTRGHLEPWLSLLGPPHGGSALATPDYRDGLLATNQMNMRPTGHGLVPPCLSVHTALGHHGRSRGKASVGGHAAQPPPASTVFITHSRAAHRVSCHRKEKGPAPRGINPAAPPPRHPHRGLKLCPSPPARVRMDRGHQTSQHGQNMLTSQAQGCVGMGSVTH